MKAFFHYYFSVEGKTLSCFSSSPPKCDDLDVPAVNWQLFHFLLASRGPASGTLEASGPLTTCWDGKGKGPRIAP